MNMKKVPWLMLHDRLAVIPSRHCSLSCALAAMEACRLWQPDIIAVELPNSFEYNGMLNIIRELSPFTGVVVSKYGPVLTADVPINPYPGFTQTRKKQVHLACAMPVSPGDSIVTAIRAPQILAEHLPDWKPEVACIDDEWYPSHPQVTTCDSRSIDEFAIHSLGMECWYEQLKSQVCFSQCSALEQRRNTVMASRLQTLLKRGLHVLAVIGAAHVEPIQKLLRQPVIEDESNLLRECQGLAIRRIDPRWAWLLGWLDEYPRLVADYEAHYSSNPQQSFDLLASYDDLLRKAIQEGQRQRLPVSIRKLEALNHLLNVNLFRQSRWLPFLDSQLIPAAEACVGTRFGNVLKKVAIEYEAAKDLNSPYPQADIIVNQQGEVFLEDKSKIFRLPQTIRCQETKQADTIEDSNVRKLQGAGFGPMPLTPTEKKRMLEGGSGYRTYPPNTELLREMCTRARALTDKRLHKSSETVTQFQGSIGLGIDIKHTLRARIHQEHALYVRDTRCEPVSDFTPSNCPVVWLFNTDYISAYDYGYWPYDTSSGRKKVLSSIYALNNRRSIGGDVVQWKVAFSLIMLRGLVPFEKTAVQELLASLPEHRICKVKPGEDEDLSEFSGMSLLIACAIKHAEDRVAVANLSEIQIEPSVFEYASARGVRLIQLSREDFAAVAVEKISLDYSVPCPRGQYAEPYRHVSRFIDRATQPFSP